MADKFTLTLTYDRDEIYEWARKVKDMGGDIYKVRSLLDQFYPAWCLDHMASLTVGLMFRDPNDKDDWIGDFMRTKLSELTAEK